jgi:hypothetical protein
LIEEPLFITRSFPRIAFAFLAAVGLTAAVSAAACAQSFDGLALGGMSGFFFRGYIHTMG